MKVLHLRDATGSGAPVELHASVTVVHRPAPAERAWLLTALGTLSGGRDRGLAGEVDAHGIRFDLDDDSLTLLGFDRTVAAVVSAADLPGYDPTLADAVAAQQAAIARRDALGAELDGHRAELTAAVAERDAAGAALDELSRGEGPAAEARAAAEAELHRRSVELEAAREERGRREDELAKAVLAREGLLTDRAAAADRADAARAARREAIAVATAAAAALEEAKAGSAAVEQAAGSIDEARARLAAAEAALADVDPHHDESPINRRLAALEGRRVELARLVASLGERREDPVAKALDAVLGGSEDGAPVVAALALADTWRDLHQQISALEAGVSASEREAEERVAGALQAVAEAESEFNQPVLTPEQIAKVEAAHVAVLEAQDRAEGRFGGSRAKKRLEELRGEERRVLERLGFSTYADYMMSSSSRGVGQANRAILETTRANVAAAEELLGELPGAADRARRRTELLQRRDAVAPRVAALLGHEPTGPETEDELRTLREPGKSLDGALAELARSLTDVGIDVGPEPHDREDLELLARSYLAEERTAELRRTEAEEATAALDQAISGLRSARAQGAAELPALAALPPLAEPVRDDAAEVDAAAAQTLREARWAEAEAARAALADADQAVARRREAAEAIARLEADLARATQAESAAAQAQAAAEAAAGDTVDRRVETAGVDVAAAEAALARARTAEHAAEALTTEAGPDTGIEPLLAAAKERVAAAEGAVTASAAAEQAAAASLAAAEAAIPVAEAAVTAAGAAADAADRGPLVEDVSWELLSRLAALRSVGIGGSVPLVLDDPLGALHDDEVGPVLDRLAQMAGHVQVVVVSDREAVAEWARAQGPDRVGLRAA